MDELQKLANEIDELRRHLQSLIDKKDDLSDPEILGASRVLDALLNEYHKILARVSDLICRTPLKCSI